MGDINFTQATIAELVDQYEGGRLLLPEFQRGFVAPKKFAVDLLDSIYRKFPIGQLLVWRTNEAVDARKTTPRSSTSGGRWLLDGQQRVVSLAYVKRGHEFRVYFNATNGAFTAPAQTSRVTLIRSRGHVG